MKKALLFLTSSGWLMGKGGPLRTLIRGALPTIWILTFGSPLLLAQIVPDGTATTLVDVTLAIPGAVTIGTNVSFTRLAVSGNAILTNTVRGVIGQNPSALSNEVQLLGGTACWEMGNPRCGDSALALGLQSARPVARVAERGSFERIL